MNTRGILVLVGLGIAGVSSWFALGSDKVAEWNDRIVALTEQFSANGDELEPAIKPWAQGTRMDLGTFKVIDDAVEVYSRKTRETAEKVRAARPPDDPLCKAFHASLVEFADLQVRHLEDFAKIVDLMRKYNQPSPRELEEIGGKLDALEAESQVLVARAGTKQAEMAKKFRIKILNQRK